MREVAAPSLPWAERVARLYRRTRGGVRWGLERIQALLAAAGHPERRFAALHIAGTNGKGSVAALCAAALSEVGRVGLYTSPHLVRFEERIRVDGAPIDPDVLSKLLDRLESPIEETGATFFEATTALAFLAFAEVGVDIAVVEVGLGGRLDATNVIRPEVSVVTSIDYDHQEFLGDTLEAIAAEKAGIFKPGTPAIVGEPRASLRPVFLDAAHRVGAPVTFVDDVGAVESVAVSLDGTHTRLRTSEWGIVTIRLPLVGEHQARNALIAAEALARLPAAWRPSASIVAERWRHIRWPGRFEVVPRAGGWWVFDVAHNPASIEALVRTLRRTSPPRPWVAVVGILGDKDWRSMVARLAPLMDELLCVAAPSAPPERQWDPAVAAETARSLGARARALSFDDALTYADATAATAIVTGSFTTVGDSRRALGLDP